MSVHLVKFVNFVIHIFYGVTQKKKTLILQSIIEWDMYSLNLYIFPCSSVKLHFIYLKAMLL